MKFITTVLAVKDIERSKNFYQKLFKQKITLDLGRNVTFHGGFTLQQDFDWLLGIDAEKIKKRSHNMELYFEVDNFNLFLKKLDLFPEIKWVHPPRMHSWKQRVIRVYDPDGHIIEIGESMRIIAQRYLEKGYSAEKVAAIIEHPIDFVRHVAQTLKT
jgi:catechol 2,3-dioxygenase-like lactoylglutathione lyase family enzyme